MGGEDDDYNTWRCSATEDKGASPASVKPNPPSFSKGVRANHAATALQ